MRVRPLLLVSIALACGGSSAPGGPLQIELTAAGLNPSSTSAVSGGQVNFVNHDTAAHQIASTSCSELASGQLAAGASFLTAVGTGPKSCTFNDGLNPTALQFQGTINVAAPGSGY